jgi:peptide/nickel transport system substrate-binding protein
VRKAWYGNLKEVTVNGPYEVKFELGRPQPSMLSILAVGWSAVYPCHVDGKAMRQKPIGTGPYKFAEYKPNEMIRLVRKPSTGSRACRTSTPSNIASCPACRRVRSPS